MPQLRIVRVPNPNKPNIHVWHVFRYRSLIGEITRMRDETHDTHPYEAFLIRENGRKKFIGSFRQKDGRNRAIRLIGVFANRDNNTE